MSKIFEIYVERAESYKFSAVIAETEEDARQFCYEAIEEGNVDPYITDWHTDVFEK